MELKDKTLLTIKETVKVFGIGENTIRKLTQEEDADFVIHLYNKKLIDKELFLKYLRRNYT